MTLLLIAAAIEGIAAGFGYRGSLEVVNQIAPGEQRSEVVSSYLVTVYAGNALRALLEPVFRRAVPVTPRCHILLTRLG